MKGCRPLNDREFKEVLESFDGPFEKRDRALFLVGSRTGFRISELLTIRVTDMVQHGRLSDRIGVRRQNMKGQVEGRTVALHPQAREAIAELLKELKAKAGGSLAPDTYLFQGRRRGNRPISRVQAWRVLKRAFAKRQLVGRLATHTMKKTFAEKVYKNLNRDLFRLQAALGHRAITSTVCYLSFLEEDIDEAIRTI